MFSFPLFKEATIHQGDVCLSFKEGCYPAVGTNLLVDFLVAYMTINWVRNVRYIHKLLCLSLDTCHNVHPLLNSLRLVAYLVKLSNDNLTIYIAIIIVNF